MLTVPFIYIVDCILMSKCVLKIVYIVLHIKSGIILWRMMIFRRVQLTMDINLGSGN